MVRWIITVAAAAITFSMAGSCAAESYPDHVIKIVVPYTPGGAIDVTARIVAKRLGEVLRHPVIIENRVGASGMLANRAVASAEPDGYTLLFGNASTLTVIPTISHTRDFEVLKRLAPVARITQGHEVMVVDPAGPANTLSAFIAYAKANPGKLNFGSVGFGNLTHVAGELLKQNAGIDMQHVPYKGSSEVVAGLLSGQVQMTFMEIAGALPLARQDKIRPLAIASAMRDPKISDIPTFIEQGVPDLVVPTFTGVLAPVGTPPAIVAMLNGAINAVLAHAETHARLENLGAAVRPDTVEEFTAFLAAEQHKWEEVVTHAGLRGE
jgi:tripartite-type tricarboxylate transporter receptor subunit TctC